VLVVGLLAGLLAVVAYARERKAAPLVEVPTLASHAQELTHSRRGRVYGTDAIQQAIFENARREDRTTVEAELVTMIEEGKKLCEEEFTGTPSWHPYYQWRQELLEFIGTVFGDAERQRFIEVEVAGAKPRDHVTAVMEWLRARRDHPEGWALQVEGEQLAAAIGKRRGASGTPSGTKALADHLDDLIREGMEFRKELAVPVEPIETKPGNWLIEGGAPDGWWEKVEVFDKRVRDLLRAERPGLLHTYAEGHNTYVRTRREMEADDASDTTEDKRPSHERVLAIVNESRSGPVRLMDALLEGVSAARRQLGLETGQ